MKNGTEKDILFFNAIMYPVFILIRINNMAPAKT